MKKLLLFFCLVVAQAQETIDFSAAGKTIPYSQSDSLPGGCRDGQLHRLKTDDVVMFCKSSSWYVFQGMQFTTVLPSGSCTSAISPVKLYGSTLYGCPSGTWASIGGGTTNAILHGTDSPFATITRVQNKKLAPPLTSDTSVTSGNTIIVAVAGQGSGTCTLTDNQGNTYTQIDTQSSAAGNPFGRESTVFLFRAVASATGSLVITAAGTFPVGSPGNTGVATGGFLMMQELSGVDTSSPVLTTAKGTSAGESLTVAQPSLLLVSVAQTFYNLSGWTAVNSAVAIESESAQAVFGYRDVTSAGSYAPGFTSGAPMNSVSGALRTASNTISGATSGSVYFSTSTLKFYLNTSGTWSILGALTP